MEGAEEGGGRESWTMGIERGLEVGLKALGVGVYLNVSVSMLSVFLFPFSDCRTLGRERM